MTNLLYPLYKENVIAGNDGYSLSAAVVKVVLVDTVAYTYAATDQYLSDVAAGARIHTSPALASKTFTGGTFDAANTTLTAVTAGPAAEALVLYTSTGAEASSELICYIDTGSGLPITPDNTDIVISWNASGIFAI